MLSSDETKSGGKSGHRKEKPAQAGRKAEKRKRKAAARQDVKPDRFPDTAEDISAAASSAESSAAPSPVVESHPTAPAAAQAAPVVESHPTAPAAAQAAPVVESHPTAPAGTQAAPVDYGTLADAYGDYSRTSLEQARSFLEQLAAVRSFDKVVALQTAFARQAYENFATQSQRISELHRELARQRWKRLEGLITGKAGDKRDPARQD